MANEGDASGDSLGDGCRYVPVCNPCEMSLSHPVGREGAKRIASRHQDRFGHSTGITEVRGADAGREVTR